MFRFPFGTVQELNLDWFLEQWEIFKVQAREAFEGIDHALDDEIDRVEAAMTDLYAARDAAIAAKTAAETAESTTLGYAQSAANSAASAAGSATGSAQSASSSAGSAEQAAQSAQTSAQQASSAATSAGNAATSATNASSSAATAANNATISTTYSQESAAWATGSYTGDPSLYPVPSTAPQHENNAKYYADAAAGSATAAAGSATAAAGSASDAADSAASVSASAAQIAQNASDIADLQTDMTAAESAITDLKTALNEDINDLKESISAFDKKSVTLIQYVKGGLNANGSTNTSNNRVRHSIRFAEYDIIVYCDPSKEFRIALYNNNDVSANNFVRFVDTDFSSESKVIPKGYYYVILGRNTQDPSAEITDTMSFTEAIKPTITFFDNSILQGLKLSLLGDSISAFKGYVPTGYDYYYGDYSFVLSVNEMWWSVLCNELGLTPLVINAYSGSGITQLEDPAHVSKIPMSSDERCNGLGANGETPDIILIAGGVNDYNNAQSAQSEPLLWNGKSAPVIGNSFTEAYACMIKKLQTNYPNAIIVALSTWFTCLGNNNGYTFTHTSSGNVYTQTDYNNAIKTVAEIMHIAYLDVSTIGFNISNYYPNYASDNPTNPCHPNKFGQTAMGKYIADKLPSIISAYFFGKLART